MRGDGSSAELYSWSKLSVNRKNTEHGKYFFRLISADFDNRLIAKSPALVLLKLVALRKISRLTYREYSWCREKPDQRGL